MYYVDYEEKIVQRYGIELVGWTYEKFVNPSELSTLLPGLQQLLDAINNGSCKFIKLSPLQLIERHQALQKSISDGSVPAPQGRKPCKDRGTKRTMENESSGGSDVENQQPKPKKRRSTVGKKNKAWPKSREVVEDTDD